jgi:COMPASS component SWD3
MENETHINYIQTQTIEAHTRPVSTLKFSGNGKYLASGGADGVINLYPCSDTISCTPRRCEHVHEFGINEISWSEDSNYIASAGDDKLIVIWDVQTVTKTNIQKLKKNKKPSHSHICLFVFSVLHINN